MFDLTAMEVMPQLCHSDSFFYLAFRHGHQSPEVLFSKWAETNSWTVPVRINDPIYMLFEIQLDGSSAITAASRGGCFVTWIFYDYNPEGIWRVQYTESWDGGLTWSYDAEGICDEIVACWEPSIAMDGSGNLYELWKTGMNQIRWDHYMHGGGWGYDNILYDRVGASFPAFDVMTNSHQHVCFVDAKLTPAPLFYMESDDLLHWIPPVSISPDEGEAEMPSVKVWELSKVGVTWKQHGDSYTNDILYREKNL